MANSVDDLEIMFDILQGQDSNDSNCIDFSKIQKIRDHKRVMGYESAVQAKELRVGIVQEFDVEELD